jgi:hypothetical protein
MRIVKESKLKKIFENLPDKAIKIPLTATYVIYGKVESEYAEKERRRQRRVIERGLMRNNYHLEANAALRYGESRRLAGV